MAEARHRGLWVVAGAVLTFLYLPLLLVVVYSFNRSRLNAEWTGFTLDWYRLLLQDTALLAAARNSLLVAGVASLAATVLGTAAGFALHQRGRSVGLSGLLLAAVALPEVLQGVSLLVFFVMLHLTLGLVSVTLAHIAFCISFVAVIVRARLQDLDAALVDAARDLGASPAQAFLRVTLPLAAPGIAAGALMAFTLSLDDFVITFFTAGPQSLTLPLQVYAMIRLAVTPEINAVSTLLMLLTLGLILLTRRLVTTGRGERDLRR